MGLGPPPAVQLVANGMGRKVELPGLPPEPTLADVLAAVGALLAPGTWISTEHDDVEPLMPLYTLQNTGRDTSFHRFFLAPPVPVGQAGEAESEEEKGARGEGDAGGPPCLMAVRQSPLLTHRLPPSHVPAAPFLQNVGSLRVWGWTPSHQKVRVEHGSCPAGGGHIQLPVQAGTTVAEVKRQLAAVVGLPPEQQVLIAHDPSEGVDLAERELICPEQATLEELGITPAWWLEVQPGPLEESMPLSVVLPSGKYHSMHAAPSIKVCHLKRLLMPIIDQPPRGIQLRLRSGRALRDPEVLSKHLQRGETVLATAAKNLSSYQAGTLSRAATLMLKGLRVMCDALRPGGRRLVEVVHPDGSFDLLVCHPTTTVQQIKATLQQHWESGQVVSERQGVWCASLDLQRVREAAAERASAAAAVAQAEGGTAGGAQAVAASWALAARRDSAEELSSGREESSGDDSVLTELEEWTQPQEESSDDIGEGSGSEGE